MPAVAMRHDLDPKDMILDQLGDDISGFEIPDCHVLIATYRRPEKTSGGIVLPAKNLEEDLYQSKVGLVIRVGHGATYNGAPVELQQWLVIRPSDAWALEVIRPGNSVHCRIVYDKHIRGRVDHPDFIW